MSASRSRSDPGVVVSPEAVETSRGLVDEQARHPVVHTPFPERAFGWCAAAFAAAAAITAAVHAISSIPHGWWLVAYLALVGGLSQSLLGTGLAALVSRSGSHRPGAAATWSQLGLWNAGTVMVAIADLGGAPGGVLAGSALLLAALGMFAAALRRTRASARRPVPVAWISGYVLLIVFLAGSVLVGAGLAEALPGQ
jgi:hypothetical protein